MSIITRSTAAHKPGLRESHWANTRPAVKNRQKRIKIISLIARFRRAEYELRTLK